MQRRVFCRFSLRAGLVFVAVLCAMLAVIGRRTQRLWSQKRAADAFAAAGTWVSVRHPFEERLSESSERSLPFWLAAPPHVVDIEPKCGTDRNLLRTAVLRCSHLPYLERLRLEILAFEFDDECAAQFESLNELRCLHVPGSPNLTAAGFKKLLRPKLEELILGRCDLAGLEIEPGVWPASLTVLSLGHCDHLSGDALAVMLSGELKVAAFDATELTDDELYKIRLPPGLASVTIVNAKSLTSRGLVNLLGPQIESFHVYGAELSDADLRNLPLPDSLAELTLSPCPQLTNASVASVVRRCPNLLELRVRSPLLDDQVVEHLMGVGSRIELASPSLSDVALARLSRQLSRTAEIVVSPDGRVGHVFKAGNKAPWRGSPSPW